MPADRRAANARYYAAHRKPGPPQWRACAICGAAFKATRSTAKYCPGTSKCRTVAYRQRHKPL